METKVIKVRSYSRTSKSTGEMRAMVCINDKIHVSKKQLEGLGFGDPRALVGSDVKVEFYKNGEDMFNNVKCTSDDTIVKSLEVEFTSQDLTFIKAANAGIRSLAIN